MSDTTHSEHPTVRQYLKIFYILGVLTAVELAVAIIYNRTSPHLYPKSFLVISLVLLALWKAALVAMHFMHLKMDPRRLSIAIFAPVVALTIFVLIMSFESLVKHHIPYTDKQPPPVAEHHGE